MVDAKKLKTSVASTSIGGKLIKLKNKILANYLIFQKVLEKSTGKFKLYLKYGNFSKYFINLRQKTND
jgi:hypothetical protein